MKTKILTTAAFVFLFLGGMTKAIAHDEYTRVIKKDFPVNPDANLIISNKFGQVHLNNWEKNIIAFEVKITVEASDERAAAKILDKISVNISGSQSQVEARTEFDGGDLHGKNKVHIDYMVNIPATVNLDLTNKFGDIYINQLEGKAKIDLSYGDMEVNKFNNSDNLIEIKFGTAEVKSIKGAVLTLKYSKMNLDYAGSLRLDSKYSDMNASQVISLTGNFEGGSLTLENSTALDTKTKFSNLQVTRLDKNLNLDIQYGNFEVEQLPPDFNSLTINNKYGTVSVGIAKNASYLLDADLKFCELSYPEESASFTQKIITNTTKSYKGTVGKLSNPTSKVYIRSEFGHVSLED